MILKITVKGAKRRISHLKSALKYRLVGVVKQITSLVKPVNIEIGNVRYPRRLLKASGKISIIVAKLCRKLLKSAFTHKILLHKSEYLRK